MGNLIRQLLGLGGWPPTFNPKNDVQMDEEFKKVIAATALNDFRGSSLIRRRRRHQRHHHALWNFPIKVGDLKLAPASDRLLT